MSRPLDGPYPSFARPSRQEPARGASIPPRLETGRSNSGGPPSPAPPLTQHNSDPTLQTHRSGSGSSGSGSALLGGWSNRLRPSSGGGAGSGNLAGVGAPGSRVQAGPMGSGSGRPLSPGAFSGAPAMPLSAPLPPSGAPGHGWPNSSQDSRQPLMDHRLQGRHSFSEGQASPAPLHQVSRDDELARVERESIKAEEERLRALAEQERQLRLTLAASAHTSERDRLRADQLARAQLAEEEALRKAMAESRRDSDTGKQRETEAERREREELELVLALSLSESKSHLGRTGTMTSAQMWDRLTRPAEENEEQAAPTEIERAERRRGKAREDSFATSSTTAHPLFNAPVDSRSSSPPDQPPSEHPTSSSGAARPSSPEAFAEPPPAYQFPEYAAELDEPDAVIIGPGRPIHASQPVASTSSTSSTRDRPPPTPPRIQTQSSNNHRLHPSPPLARNTPSPHSYYSNAVAAALEPHNISPRPTRSPSRDSDYFISALRPRVPRNNTRDSFLSIISIAGSFESTDSQSSDRTTRWSIGGGSGVNGSPGILVEEAEGDAQHDDNEVENPFGDRFAEGVAQPREPSPVQAEDRSDLFGILREQARHQDEGFVLPPDASTSASAHRLPPSPVAATSPSHRLGSEYDERDNVDLFSADADRRRRSPSPMQSPSPDDSSSPISPAETITSLDSALRQRQDHLQPSSSGLPYLSLTPSASDATFASFATSQSSTSLASALSPSFGGFVSASASTALADEQVLTGVKWGFVDEARKTMHPPLEHEGDFPRAAQLSRVGQEGEESVYGCFAVEARGWGSLLTFLMWYGNSRIEAAPSDIQRDKANRGLSISICLEFFLSFEDQQPRVRVRVDLLPPSALLTSPSIASFASLNDPALPANIYDPLCPSISIRLPQSALLPIPLSSLATLLSAAHSRSRQAIKHSSHSALSQAAVPYATSAPGSPNRDLAYAIDLFKRLNGEGGVNETAEEVEAKERGVLERLKGRLRRRKKAPGIVKGGADGTEPGGRRLEGTDRLPEGANLITPFVLDERD